MHIEIQVALNFVISYLYNKLPRRRVNIFGEELEKALKDKFQGHWYPEKPFKGSAFRCLKTGDPIDAVLERAARESGVPIADILENLPNELSVWVDPGEVSYRIGEKGLVKILYSENCDNHEENTSADREVNKTFNPEAQCFRPIDVVSTNMNGLSLSPKTSPHSGSSPHSATSSTSPTRYKGSPNPGALNGIGGVGMGSTMNGVVVGLAAAAAAAGTTLNGATGVNSGAIGSSSSSNGSNTNGGGSAANSFMQRNQAPLTFTTATFAQTKFGSTKLKTSSKRANSSSSSNSSSYRMSPTEFSNYIKQRAMQQQMHHGHPGGPPPQQQQHQQQQQQQQAQATNHFGPIGPVSPARSLSPNPLGLGLGQATGGDPFYFPSLGAMGMAGGYPQFNGHRNIFDAGGAHVSPHYHPTDAGVALYGSNGGASGGNTPNSASAGVVAPHSKFSTYLEPHAFYGMGGGHQLQQAMPPPQQQQHQQQNGNINKSNGSAGGIDVAVKEGNNTAAVGVAAAITVTVSAAAAVNGVGEMAAAANDTADISPVICNATANNNNTNNNMNSSNNTNGSSATASLVAAAVVAANNQQQLQQQQQQQQQDSNAASGASGANAATAQAANATSAAAAAAAAAAATANNSKFEIDGLNAFYTSNPTGATYQQLLVAN